MEKVGRNDPCPCGSGKKYKKCCEEKIKHKKFEAQPLSKEQAAPSTDKASKLSTSFFQRTVQPKSPHRPPEDHPPESTPPL